MNFWIDFPWILQWLIVVIVFDLITNAVLLIPVLKLRKKTKIKPSNFDETPISILIAARNESENLLELIPELFKLEYSSFEVVVVDDCSYDDTHDVLLALGVRYPSLKTAMVVENNNFSGGKKFALTLGIKAASNENCVFLDADCRPKTTNWLKGYNQQFNEGKDLVLGYGGFNKTKSILNFLINYEAATIAFKYFGLAKWKNPYMGVGRNIGYTKKLFFSVKGFAKHIHIPFGDDDLFVNQVSEKAKLGMLTTNEYSTVSIAKVKFNEYWNQKRRHIDTFKYYNFRQKAILTFIELLNLTVWVMMVMSICFNLNSSMMLLLIIVGYLALKLVAYVLFLKDLDKVWLAAGTIILEPILIVFKVLLPIFNSIKNQVLWKT